MVKEVRIVLGDEEHFKMRQKKGSASWRQILMLGVEQKVQEDKEFVEVKR